MEISIDCPLAPILAERLRDARAELTTRWLDRIVARVSLDPDRIFPAEDLLDHMPLLVEGIADYLENPSDEISADVPVIAKAMELGEMRQSQGFSAHEILKEYEILGGVLYAFLVRIVDEIDEDCTRSQLLACGHRLFRAVSVIQQVTTTQYLRLADGHVHEREERLRSFNRMVTHELKNRIGAVQGAVRMLQEPWVDEDPEERERFLSVIDRNAEGMQETLHDLIGLSRTDTNARKQRYVQLPEAVAEAARQLRDMARERGVEIRVADDLPRIEVSAAAVELALVNYISNGIKYSDPQKPERWVDVRAERRTGPDGEGELVIEVRDNGTGISPEARDRVFERYYRESDDDVVDGMGLGLSIVRETVNEVGGRAWAEVGDEGESGCCFKIALPARRVEDADAGKGEVSPTADPVSQA